MKTHLSLALLLGMASLNAGPPALSDFYLAGHDGHSCYHSPTCYDNPLLIRADQDGNIVWQRSLPVGYWLDRGYIRNADRNVTEDSLYLSTVFDESKIGGLHRILKYSKDGVLEWDRPIAAAQMAVSANAVLGGLYAAQGSELIRIDAAGTVLWRQTFAYPVAWVTTDVTSGDAHIVGGVQSGTVTKVSASGSVIWTRNLAPHTAAQTMSNPLDGGVYVGCDEYTHYTARLDRDGNVIWWMTGFPVAWPSGGTAYGRVVEPVTGALYIGGWPNRYGKLSATATPLWNIETLTYNAYADARLDGNGVYISGNFSYAGIAKHNGDGSLAWRKWIGPASWNGGFYDMPAVYVGAPAAAATIPSLILTIQTIGAGLPAGSVTSLVTKLEAAQQSLQRGQTNAACGQLGAAQNEVDAMKRSGRISAAQANTLTTGLTQVRTAVPCRV